MYRTILVPFDGSPLGERALPYATFLARPAHARILLLRAVAGPAFAVADPIPDFKQELREAGEYLHRLATTVTRPIVVETATFPGDAADAITREVSLRQADLVVMATHGRSGLGRWVVGSVADAVVRRATGPVLLVPPAAMHPWPDDRPLRILVPLDGSGRSSEILGPASRLAGLLGARITLLRVVERQSQARADASTFVVRDPTAEIATARAHLESVASELRNGGSSVKIVTTVGSPAGIIAKVAREEPADVIAMSTHGSGGLARLLLGSVTADVVRRASVPVLTVRSAASADRAEGTDVTRQEGTVQHPTMA